jgi:senataxin
MVFFDIKDSCERSDGNSKFNPHEADLTRKLIELIALTASKNGNPHSIAGKIGVISPYKAQVNEVKDRLGSYCRERGCRLQDTFEVNTVDAFQGREKEIIIFNCVRSNDKQSLTGSLGFLLDERRLNVAITRPQHFLFIIGNAQTLSRSETWKSMIAHHQKEHRRDSMFISLPNQAAYKGVESLESCILS